MAVGVWSKLAVVLFKFVCSDLQVGGSLLGWVVYREGELACSAARLSYRSYQHRGVLPCNDIIFNPTSSLDFVSMSRKTTFVIGRHTHKILCCSELFDLLRSELMLSLQPSQVHARHVPVAG